MESGGPDPLHDVLGGWIVVRFGVDVIAVRRSQLGDIDGAALPAELGRRGGGSGRGRAGVFGSATRASSGQYGQAQKAVCQDPGHPFQIGSNLSGVPLSGYAHQITLARTGLWVSAKWHTTGR